MWSIILLYSPRSINGSYNWLKTHYLLYFFAGLKYMIFISKSTYKCKEYLCSHVTNKIGVHFYFQKPNSLETMNCTFFILRFIFLDFIYFMNYKKHTGRNCFKSTTNTWKFPTIVTMFYGNFIHTFLNNYCLHHFGTVSDMLGP